MDDRAAALLRDDIIEELADGDDADAIDAIASIYSGDHLGKLSQTVVNNKDTLDQPVNWPDILGWFDLPDDFDADRLLDIVFDGTERALFDKLLPILRNSDKVTDNRMALRLHDLDFNSLKTVETLCGILLTGSGAKQPFTAKTGSVPTKASRAAMGAARRTRRSDAAGRGGA